MKKLLKQKLNEFYTHPLGESIENISYTHLKNIPKPIQKYLKKCKIVGNEEIKRVRLKQEGKFKLKPNSDWKSYSAEQYINTENYSFLWHAKIKLMPLIKVYVIDYFIKGEGRLIAKLFSLFKMVDESGKEIDQGELVRFLTESAWYPSFLCNEKIQWNIIDENEIEIILDYKDQRVSGKINFNKEGYIEEFTAKRFYTSGDTQELEKMSGYLYNYKEMAGIIIPTKFKVCWHLEEGDYYYIKAEITEIEFNNPNRY
ncbi:MAG: hypothetical protein GF329_22670 [Candidatus Lokiarchaeota archaeon]|nr:hypothetical protein [Candidatus Lokiarchaeota archaeon]